MFRAWSFGLRALGSEFGVLGLGLEVNDLGIAKRVCRLGVRGFRSPNSKHRLVEYTMQEIKKDYEKVVLLSAK